MGHYSTTPDDAEPNIELAQEVLDRCRPLEEGSPPWRYLVATRGLPEGAVRYCAADLRELHPPIPGLDRSAYGVVSLLRGQDGELTGLAIEGCGPAGERLRDASGATVRREFALRAHGCRDGVFRVGATGDGAMVCYSTEGRLAKVIAVAAALRNPAVVGVGSRNRFGNYLPPESIITMVEDAAPQDEKHCDQHLRDMERGADRYLLGGRSVLRITGPRCGCCKDPDAALLAHGPEELARWLVEDAEPVDLSLDGWARRAAKIRDPLRRAEIIADAAEKHELRKRGMTAAFREQVAKYAGGHVEDPEDPGQSAAGAEVVFTPIIAAAAPQDGAQLLEDMTAAIHRHAHCDNTDATMGALWVLHAARREHGNIGTLPRLIITAGREDSGKTHFALALAHMMERAEHTVSPRPANMYRAIEAHGCAFFLDETDDWYARSPDLQEIINSGFNRSGASIMRVEDRGREGKRQLEVRRFSTFTPMCLIGIDLLRILPRTVVSRALTIHMRPARAGEEVEDLYDNPPAVAALRTIAGRAKRWIADNERALTAAGPERPPSVINRLWITWKPLLALAELAGGRWPSEARAALEVARARTADPGLGIQLLGDMLEILARAPGGRMHTGDIIGRLVDLELRTWRTFGKARAPLRDIDIATLIGPYETRPTQLKISGRNRRGYVLDDLVQAAERYAPHLLSDAAGNPRYPRYPATDTDNSKESAAPQGSGPKSEPSTSATEPATSANSESEVAATRNGGATPFPEEDQSGSGVAGLEGVPSEKEKSGTPNGQIPHPALVCARCSKPFLPANRPGAKPKYCSDACRKAARAARIRGADVTPRTERLP